MPRTFNSGSPRMLLSLKEGYKAAQTAEKTDKPTHHLTSTGCPSGPMISGLPLGPVLIPGRIICCAGLGAGEAGRPEVLGSWPDADATATCLTRLRGAATAACARSDNCMWTSTAVCCRPIRLLQNGSAILVNVREKRIDVICRSFQTFACLLDSLSY